MKSATKILHVKTSSGKVVV